MTGLGVVTPLGIGCDRFWTATLEGEIGTRPITRFPVERYRTHQGGEVPGFDPVPWFSRLDPSVSQRSTQLAVCAARQAVTDSSLAEDDFAELGERSAVVMGAVVANRPGLSSVVADFHAGRRSAPYSLVHHDVDWVSDAIAAELGITGGSVVLPTACAAGNSALALGADWIAGGDADVVIAGGADEIDPSMFMMFSLFGALSPDRVRPFDRGRRGLILAEGAAALVLEAETHARARGARVYGRVAGSGNYGDAYDMTHPHPDGAGALLSMQAALREADLDPGDIGYVSAHGTGTRANDGIEARAIRKLFGSQADTLPVSSIKSMLGHAQGAASAIEAVSCLLAMRDSIVPPTMNFEQPDPECPIDVVPNRPRTCRVDAALNNGFGFGGNICCVVLTRA